MSGAWAQSCRLAAPVPELTEQERRELARRGRCAARVPGTVDDVCWRKVVGDTAHCYYHQPGTAHMAFVDDRPDFFFGVGHGPLPRSDSTCRTRLGNGKFCTGWCGAGNLYCFSCDRRRPGRRRCNSV